MSPQTNNNRLGKRTMKYLTTVALAAGIAVVCSAAVLAQTAPQAATPAPKAAAVRPPPTPATGEVTAIPANLKPDRIRSSAIIVADLPGMTQWYQTVLGFVKTREVNANEYVFSLEPGNANATALILQKGARQPGATTYGRLIINVTNAKGIADFLQTHGVTTQQVIPNQAYFINDPEGNRIEIYTATPPAVK
jgi:catechol 2,3-dioxygenase-like lactoylglutathione lyase family enzyme